MRIHPSGSLVDEGINRDTGVQLLQVYMRMLQGIVKAPLNLLAFPIHAVIRTAKALDARTNDKACYAKM